MRSEATSLDDALISCAHRRMHGNTACKLEPSDSSSLAHPARRSSPVITSALSSFSSAMLFTGTSSLAGSTHLLARRASRLKFDFTPPSRQTNHLIAFCVYTYGTLFLVLFYFLSSAARNKTESSYKGAWSSPTTSPSQGELRLKFVCTIFFTTKHVCDRLAICTPLHARSSRAPGRNFVLVLYKCERVMATQHGDGLTESHMRLSLHRRLCVSAHRGNVSWPPDAHFATANVLTLVA